ncbi:uncharacterized protein LOC130898124 [Diorhabda carinulata]|uniref:uncharacterized protein LOC130898124 n=1 Tax=Diorhabda carinulata TaxID=1163345 RepID=UPI0025A09C93|nr:uncharacterized protein LOC130898124 [Diorhabda carinulata]
MDISEKLLQMALEQKETEKRSKMVTELSSRKCELQKSLRDTKSMVDIKQHELDSLKKECISLSCELPVWREKVKIAKQFMESLVKQVVEQDEIVYKLQTDLWTHINEWISNDSKGLQKNISSENRIAKCADTEEKIKEERLKQIKLEGKLQAMRTFEKYQQKKIAEMRQIKNIIDNADTI